MSKEETYCFAYCEILQRGQIDSYIPYVYGFYHDEIMSRFEGPRDCLKAAAYNAGRDVGVIAVKCDGNPSAYSQLLSFLTYYQAENFFRFGTLFKGMVCSGELSFDGPYAYGEILKDFSRRMMSYSPLPRIIVNTEIFDGTPGHEGNVAGGVMSVDNDGVAYVDYIPRLRVLIDGVWAEPCDGRKYLQSNVRDNNPFLGNDLRWVREKLGLDKN